MELALDFYKMTLVKVRKV